MGGYRWGAQGRFLVPDERMSVLQIIESGTLDLRLSSLLWLLMERRPSVLVAAGPSFAGKTTTLNVLVDFLRPEIAEVRLSGYDEDFSFVKDSQPSGTYIVAEEFSDYGDYVWGETAHKAFALIKDGYGLGGTIHARTPREVVYILNQYLGLPIEDIARLDAIVTLNAVRGRARNQVIRQIDSVSLFVPVGEQTGIQTIASTELGGGSFAMVDDKTLQAAFSKKFPSARINVVAELKKRETALGGMLSARKVSRDDVRKGIVDFYNSHKAF
jgi:hypothetical protein